MECLRARQRGDLGHPHRGAPQPLVPAPDGDGQQHRDLRHGGGSAPRHLGPRGPAHHLGWRGSFLALGIATLVCVLPLVLVAGRIAPPAPTPGRRREARASPTAAPAADREAGTLREALGSKRLRLLLVIYAICGFQDFLVATHVVAFALDEGVDTLLAGNMLAFMGLTGLAGVLLAGVLNDRFGPVLPTVLCFVLRIGVSALVLASREPAFIVGAALLYGVTFWMTAPLAVVFAREVAGLALLGTVSGLITMVHHGAGASARSPAHRSSTRTAPTPTRSPRCSSSPSSPSSSAASSRGETGRCGHPELPTGEVPPGLSRPSTMRARQGGRGAGSDDRVNGGRGRGER